MLCGHMIPLQDQGFVPCGQCHACRVNRLRKTVGQILLEATYSEKESTFLTLTYNDDHLPDDGSLRPDHSYNFINRLRNKALFQNAPLRYFIVGEYGDQTQRPHYHACIFGIPPEVAELPTAEVWSEDGRARGFIQAGSLTPQSASYIAGYCTKKMGRNDERLQGRYPEFNRRSKQPPLGAEGIYRIIDSLYTRRGAAALAKSGTIPTSFRLNNATYPISDYWRKYISEETGFPANTGPKPWEVDFQGFLKDQSDAKITTEKAKHRSKLRSKKTL